MPWSHDGRQTIRSPLEAIVMQLGPLELGLILVIVLLIFGAGKLPEVFRSMGEGIREFRQAASTDEKEDKAPADSPNNKPQAS